MEASKLLLRAKLQQMMSLYASNHVLALIFCLQFTKIVEPKRMHSEEAKNPLVTRILGEFCLFLIRMMFFLQLILQMLAMEQVLKLK
jgi:hypothetical protein